MRPLAIFVETVSFMNRLSFIGFSLQCALCLLTVGCGTSSKLPPQNPQETPAVVEPQVEVRRDEFVFADLPELLRKFGYAGFCPTRERCDWRLPYGLYKGMRGYFLDEGSVEVQGDTEVYRVRFNTGETYYYFASRRLGGKFAPVAPIVPLLLQEKVETFKPEPLVPCSDISLVEARIQFGQLLYRLSNNRILPADKLEAIRRIAEEYGIDPAPLAERLLDAEIRLPSLVSKSPANIEIEPLGVLKANDVRLLLRVGENGVKPYLRMQYFGDSWIYLRMLEFQAGQRVWQRWGLRVRRQEQDGQVREWVELPAEETELAIAEALAAGHNARIRFEGARVYAMLNLTEVQKEDLSRMLEIYRLMSASTEYATARQSGLPAPEVMCGN